jgi:hypothetical protein
MNPRKSNFLGVSASYLHFALQVQLGKAIEWSRSPPEDLRLHPVQILKSLGGFGISRRDFSSDRPFLGKRRI